jgi:hypothetical protein
LLNRANDALVAQLSRTRAGTALVNLSERGAQRAEQAFVNNRLREVDDATRAEVQTYANGLERGPIRGNNPRAAAYQQRVTGTNQEFNLQHPGDDLGMRSQWADNIDPSRAAVVDAKFASNPAHGVYGNESTMQGRLPDRWDNARAGQVTEMSRYADRIASPDNPLQRVIVTTNHPGAVEYFADIMNEAGVRNGVVVVVP